MTPPLIKRFLIALDEHRLLGALIFLLILGGSVVFALQPKPEPETREDVYKAVGALSFRTPPPIFTTTGEQLQLQGRVSIDREFLLSPRVLEGVKDTLRINAGQLSALVKQLEVILPGEGDNRGNEPAQNNLIQIEYEGVGLDNATQAKVILRVFMSEMIEYSRWLNSYQLRDRVMALEDRLALVQQDLTNAEEAFYRYISDEGSALLAIQDGSLFNSITNTQVQQRETQLALEELNGQINSLVNQLGLTPEQAYTSAVLSADPIIANLRAQILENETAIEQLEKRLRPEHPQMVFLQNRKQANEKQLQQRAEELIGGDGILIPLPDQIRQESNLDVARQALANQLIALETQREGLEKQLESLRETEQQLRLEYERFPDKQLQQARLVQAVESQRILYQTILAALTDAKAAEAETISSLVIAQEPYSPPVKPTIELTTNPLLIIAGGFGLGIMAVGGLVFLLATLDDRLHTAPELRESLSGLNLPVLGQIPSIRTVKSNPVLENVESPYLAYYERVRSNIRRYGTESAKVILLTSINHKEGSSVTAYNLAIASAQAGKRTLIVEADLRSTSLASVFNIEPSPEAKVEPLRYYASRGDCINLVPNQENLYILASPGPQRQAAGILESSELQRLLRDARGRFDMVIVDTPCLSSCNDALLLEPLIDAMILVTRPGITQKSLLNETVEQFLESELPLLGAVINGVEDAQPASDVELDGYSVSESEPLTTVAVNSSVAETGEN